MPLVYILSHRTHRTARPLDDVTRKLQRSPHPAGFIDNFHRALSFCILIVCSSHYRAPLDDVNFASHLINDD